MDEPQVDTGTVADTGSAAGNAVPASPAVDSGTSPQPNAEQPTAVPTSNSGAPTNDGLIGNTAGDINYDALRETVEDEPAPEPNAAPPQQQGAFDLNTLPPTLKQAFSTSDYVKTPEQMTHAVQAAARVWDVQTGKADAGEFLDDMRTYNPEGYQRAAKQTLAAIKWATENGHLDANSLGISFGQPTASEDPTVAALRGEVTQMRTAQQQREFQERQAVEQTRVDGVRTTLKAHLAEQVKGSWLESEAEDLHDEVIKQMSKNNVGVEAFDAAYAKKDFSAYDRALKQVKNRLLDQIKTRSENVRKHAARMKNTPASPGNGSPVPVSADGLPQRKDFPDGPDGLLDWQNAYGKATRLYN